jgi:hypothetical protein
MKAINIYHCSECPHRGHTGVLAEGGSKPICSHDEAVKARIGKEGGLSKLTIPNYPAIPQWCPLPDPNIADEPSLGGHPNWE